MTIREGTAISHVSLSEDEEKAVVTIRGNRPIVYTAVKHQFPLAVALYFPDTVLEGVEESYRPESTVIRAIETSELKHERPSSRIEIGLSDDVPYEVRRLENELVVHFRKAGEAVEEPAEGPGDEPIEVTELAVPEEEREILEEADLPEGEGATAADVERAKEAPSVEEAAKVTETVPEAEKVPESGADTGQGPEAVAALVDVPKEEPEATPQAPTTAAEVEEPAWVNRVDFELMEGGKSRVVVGTTREVACDTEKVSDKKLFLKLYDVTLPEFQKRPLITTRFRSAVDRVLPIQHPNMKDTAVIAIELREAVPYRIEQKEETCMVVFEASQVPPRPTLAAKEPDWERAMKEVEAEVAEEKEESLEETVVTESGKTYSGEKISLNFQDADIRNIFRILHEVSGKNFVIGGDVQGKITLKLVNVPWDQVLDLILKMNKLGTVVEGNVIRIASLETLREEKKALQEALKAEQQAKEQEPLMTDYIAINYSDASEIKEHIDEIKTNRGRVTFDERTNTIIIKDIPPVVDRAKELAERLDLVTPQVVIEARIVEASTDFSRDIGIQWGGEYGVQTDDAQYGLGPQRGYDSLGGTYGLNGGIGEENWVVNLPAKGPTSGIGFNFARLGGLTPLTLKANLQAMEQEGKGKIISSPRILTLDNKEAYIEQGVDIPYQILEEGSYSLKWAKAVLKLTVTPHITMDRRVAMSIKAQKDSPNQQ
ncbi:MAG: type IV pilus secretin PilQ, partial [Thermodesulfobacteriota bacterium]|nr:type IV pilus secretin PilQ [Thermodesulfobacteriota bacterium]